jgi:hypothetical protein
MLFWLIETEYVMTLSNIGITCHILCSFQRGDARKPQLVGQKKYATDQRNGTFSIESYIVDLHFLDIAASVLTWACPLGHGRNGRNNSRHQGLVPLLGELTLISRTGEVRDYR